MVDACFLIKPLFWGFLIYISIHQGVAQTISGKVFDAENKQALKHVTVFIPNTEARAQTAEDGTFSLKERPWGNTSLVVSMAGYETIFKSVNCTTSDDCANLSFFLQPKEIELGEVAITANRSKAWYKRFRTFKKAFLGASSVARKCEIVNPEVIDLRIREDGTLVARANDLIEVENQATGYRVFFWLKSFRLKGEELSFAGKPMFESLVAANEKEASKWEKIRTKTFLGSRQHFLQSLIEGRLENEGYEIYYAEQDQRNGGFVTKGKANPDEILREDYQLGQKQLFIPGFLKVVYTREPDRRTTSAGTVNGLNKQMARTEEKPFIEKDFGGETRNMRHQISWLYTLKKNVSLDPLGFFEQPELVKEYGYWAWEKVAELLPRGYSLEKSKDVKNKKFLQKVPEKNGFMLEDLRIPFHEIKSGGPPKDGIPSIDNPKFVSANEAIFLEENDHVLGLEINGLAKAYPLRIMDWHEIVNDNFGDKAVVVTYCPLCGSGISFWSDVGGRKRSFGVSGLLYNSDVLLYDRQTQSLWSQIMAESVAGKSSGQKLVAIPTQLTSWKNWRKKYPETKVLTAQTGFKRDYNRQAYMQYRNSDELMFDVKNKSKALPIKSWVLGLEVNGKAKAYPFSELAKSKEKLIDVFEGTKIEISYDAPSHTASVKVDEKSGAKVLTLYWFAWYAFHPNTEIYRHRK